MEDIFDKLKENMVRSIDAFRSKKLALLNSAYKEGGQDLVLKVEDEYDALVSSYFEILRRELDKRHSKYEYLLNESTKFIGEFEESLKNMNKIKPIIESLISIVHSIGRVLIILAV